MFINIYKIIKNCNHFLNLTKQAAAEPLPDSFDDDEIGLMTKEEFLEFRNPKSQHHSSEAYNFSVADLNKTYDTVITSISEGGSIYYLKKLNNKYKITNSDGDVVGVVEDNVAYYDNPKYKNLISKFSHKSDSGDFNIVSFQQVKYLSELLHREVMEKNQKEYPIILQRLLIDGEELTVRAESEPKINKGITLVILNEDGFRVAMAANEWGATLISVAKEYRGKGLGKILTKFWYKFNPLFQSGGFTPMGQENALAVWRDRVKEFSSLGWYSELIHQGRLTKEKVKEILTGAKEIVKRQGEPIEEIKPSGDILIYLDNHKDAISFIVYDKMFLDHQDDKFIHGFGFFRDWPGIGTFIYRIEYDRPYADLTTRVALQLAKNSGEDLYDGEGYHDMIEINNIPGVVKEGDYIKINQDVLPSLKEMSDKERMLRRSKDKYNEILYSLVEMAENKW